MQSYLVFSLISKKSVSCVVFQCWLSWAVGGGSWGVPGSAPGLEKNDVSRSAWLTIMGVIKAFGIGMEGDYSVCFVLDAADIVWDCGCMVFYCFGRNSPMGYEQILHIQSLNHVIRGLSMFSRL